MNGGAMTLGVFKAHAFFSVYNVYDYLTWAGPSPTPDPVKPVLGFSCCPGMYRESIGLILAQ